jgi:hypothetical protein
MFASSEHACDQWHSSRESTTLTVAAINYAQTLKVCRSLLKNAATNQPFFPQDADLSFAETPSIMHHQACIQSEVWPVVWSKSTAIIKALYGARFSAGIHTRGCHWIPRMFA